MTKKTSDSEEGRDFFVNHFLLRGFNFETAKYHALSTKESKFPSKAASLFLWSTITIFATDFFRVPLQSLFQSESKYEIFVMVISPDFDMNGN